MLKFLKACEKKLKLILLYFRRIIFAKNNFKVSVFTKLRANIFGGYLADQYVLYDFKHNDKREYLSEFDWYRSRYINEPFEYIMNNKIACTEVLKQYAYTPEICFIKNKGVLSRTGQDVCQYSDVVDVLKQRGNLFMKPFGAGKGKGVYQIAYQENQFYVDREPSTEEVVTELLKKNDGWILCQTIEQADYLNKIYDKTKNTMRIITLRDIHTHQWKIFFAVQRIGTKETIPVDNGSRGGLVANINIETGEMSEARCLQNLEVHDVHPDSKNPIKGVVVPNWDKIKEEVLAITRNFPYMHFIAWDVLMTDDNRLCIIEANNSSGVNIIQLWGGQRHGELGDFYRYHGVNV